MNPLAWLNPGRWLLYGALVLALWLGYAAWREHQRELGRAEVRLQYAEQARRTDAARAAVAAPIAQRHAQAVERIRTVTKTITKEVPVYVPSDSCPLPGGFRVLHDAAAHGEVPEPARSADAAAVPAQDAAATVADNYGTCRETAQRLTDLQEWIRQQQALN